MLEADKFSGKVTMGPEYFAKSKFEYRNWVLAWFREALQNSVDAGATKIKFSIEPDRTGKDEIKVSCEDNGHGMDENTLTKVFLDMGGSKKSEGSTGGFGYAKVVLAFAHKRYQIDTNGVQVIGVGGDWDGTRTETPDSTGVKLQVIMDANEVSEDSLTRALKSIVGHSKFTKPIDVYLNDEPLTSSVEILPYKKSTSLGDLSFKDNPIGHGSSMLWVRMNGLAMFNMPIYNSGSTAFEGYLDLQGSSKELLTSNRDGLNSDYTRPLNDILQTLANDREKLKLTGDIDIILNERDVSLSDFTDEQIAEISSGAEEANLTPDQFLQKLIDEANSGLAESESNPFMALVDEAMKAKSLVDGKIESIPKEWYPVNFKVKLADSNSKQENNAKMASHIASSMSMKRIGKLAAGWDSVVRTLLGNENYRNAIGVEVRGNGEYYYRENLIQTGFVFGSPAALNSTEKEKKRISILMNPDYVLREKFTTADIVALAQHELTHIRIDSHYESFTDKEFEIRRIARNEIGHKNLEKSFADGIAEWRIKHSEKSIKPTKKHTVEDGYGY